MEISHAHTANIAADIKTQAASLGFDACGYARAQAVDERARRCYRQWLDDGRHGCMAWASRHADVRDDPRRLLDGAHTIVMLAMNYRPPRLQAAGAPQFAWYAYGRDYHEVLRERMRQLATFIRESTGCECRCCVDTAPLRERYWAQQAGLGFIGRNNQLILPGRGSYFFLGAVLTTLELPPDTPCLLTCEGCGACVAACPAGALSGDGAVDARRCLSCLTIELREPLPSWAGQAMGNRVYGCDACQHCCPHNSLAAPTDLADFHPTEQFLRLDAEAIRQMTPGEFSLLFSHSAVKRVKLNGLQRNLAAIDEAKLTDNDHNI
ncbi:MAG: tRNA epoxyqueuosine(34) reductase QueG [Muribaculaceae bacterium]|nr:tRNA epoxyqueuosine(34) reductase QueG [Muribaculaceae bacterium]